jgi:hypothetical protein
VGLEFAPLKLTYLWILTSLLSLFKRFYILFLSVWFTRDITQLSEFQRFKRERKDMRYTHTDKYTNVRANALLHARTHELPNTRTIVYTTTRRRMVENQCHLTNCSTKILKLFKIELFEIKCT